MPDNSQNNTDQTIKVEILDKKMTAFLSVNEPIPGQVSTVSVNDLYHALDKAGVKYGIKDDVVNDIVNGNKWGEKILVAVGTEQTPGVDAKLEYYFATEKSLKPQIAANGHVDYKEISVVCSVEKDSLLVKKTAPVLGIKGVDVTGEAVAAINGKDVNITMGQGVYKDKEDNSLIKASVDGVVFFNPRNFNLEVQQLYIIPGSVNYSTGNVHVKSSVEVRGDVEPGFSISTPYNVEIKGVVEVASISCEGTLKVKDGITGDGSNIMKIGGDLHSGYINNQVIKCGGSVYAATEIRNCVIECEDEVMIMKPNGIIIGGKITAPTKVTSPVIGNIYSIPTEIQVGICPRHKEKYLAKKKELAVVQKQFDDLRKKISLVMQNSYNETDAPILAMYNKQWKECEVKLEKVTKEAKEAEEAYFNVPDPGVYVIKSVYPGVVIKIRHTGFEVKEELSHVMFKLVKDEIVYSPYR
ncbi:MAG: FapA family protein [Ignavibacteriaceae bacterium]